MLKFKQFVILPCLITLAACDPPSSSDADASYAGPDAPESLVSVSALSAAALAIDPVSVSQSDSAIVLDWPVIDGADTYVITLSADAGFYDEREASVNSITIEGLENISYHILISARDAFAHEIASSAAIVTSPPRAVASVRLDTAP